MTIYQLMYLSEAARCGSISRAAVNLNISQPTLSESIRELEEEFSIRIFLRSNKGITLTQEGRDFLAYAHRILANVDAMQDRFSRKSSSSHLTISMSKIPFAQKSFLDLTHEFEQSSGGGSLSLIEKMTPYVLEDVISGKADIGVIMIEESGNDSWKMYMDGMSVEYNHLTEAAPVVVMRNGHPLLEKGDICVEDIVDYPVIYTYETEECFPNNNEGYYSYDLKRFPKLIYVYNQSTVYSMIEKSNAVCIVSCPNGFSALGHDFHMIPYTGGSRWNIYWIRRKQHKLSERELFFIEMLEKNKDLP